MSGTLKDKILEFRAIDPMPLLQDISDNEVRLEFERRLKDHNEQVYRNEQQLEGPAKWNAIRLHEQRRYECDLLSKLKADRATYLIGKERKEKEEALAKEIQKLENDKESCIKKRLQLRNSEPELRDLAAKIRQHLNGQILASQIQFNTAQRKWENERNVELDKQLVEADRIADELQRRRAELHEIQNRKETRQMLLEQKDDRNAKQAALRAEKEDNKRLIDELVEEENRKIAEERAEKLRLREEGIKDFRRFQEKQAEKQENEERMKDFERQLLEQQELDFERREQLERKKREAVENRIRIQEAVGCLTSELREADEKKRYAFLDANEAIAMARAELDAYNAEENDRSKAKQDMTQLRQELEQIAAQKRRAKEEQQAIEREQDRIVMEAMMNEAKKREEEKRIKQKKWTEEMNTQLEQYRAYRKQASEQEKREQAEALRRQQEYESRVQAERKAMWAEFENYLHPFTESK